MDIPTQLVNKVAKLSSQTEVCDEWEKRRFRFGGYAAQSAKTQGSRNVAPRRYFVRLLRFWSTRNVFRMEEEEQGSDMQFYLARQKRSERTLRGRAGERFHSKEGFRPSFEHPSTGKRFVGKLWP